MELLNINKKQLVDDAETINDEESELHTLKQLEV